MLAPLAIICRSCRTVVAVGHVLVERDLIDVELVLVEGQQDDQRLTNGPPTPVHAIHQPPEGCWHAPVGHGWLARGEIRSALLFFAWSEKSPLNW